MVLEHLSKNKKILFSVFIIILLGGVLFLVWSKFLNSSSKNFACTEEAKLCPDGSYVGRTGPQCEFSECPLSYDFTGWKTLIDSKTNSSFKYPENLSTKYIHPVDWPPQIQILDEQFICTEGGTEIARAGQTSKLEINNHNYCVTKESEGAAGSIYTNYAYAFPKNNKTVIFTFSLRSVQCANYDDPNKTECENERNLFNIDNTIDQIIQSFQF